MSQNGQLLSLGDSLPAIWTTVSLNPMSQIPPYCMHGALTVTVAARCSCKSGGDAKSYEPIMLTATNVYANPSTASIGYSCCCCECRRRRRCWRISSYEPVYGPLFANEWYKESTSTVRKDTPLNQEMCEYCKWNIIVSCHRTLTETSIECSVIFANSILVIGHKDTQRQKTVSQIEE